MSWTKETLPVVVLGCLFLTFCGGWYLFWVQPNDERISRIRACMIGEYASMDVTPTIGSEVDLGIYNSCVQQITGED